nr:hypothetical protein CFP56_62167 [Quercus suber]POF18660.1 hypothetical protein CFP56_62168 [Quercus suber]
MYGVFHCSPVHMDSSVVTTQTGRRKIPEGRNGRDRDMIRLTDLHSVPKSFAKSWYAEPEKVPIPGDSSLIRAPWSKRMREKQDQIEFEQSSYQIRFTWSKTFKASLLSP